MSTLNQESPHISLFSATLEQNLPLVKKLIDEGYYVDEADKNGVTPLLAACTLDLPEIAEYLLSCKAQIEWTQAQNFTPLCMAIGNKNYKIVDLLLRHGANFLHIKDGVSLLQKIKDEKSKETLERFIHHGHWHSTCDYSIKHPDTISLAVSALKKLQAIDKLDLVIKLSENHNFRTMQNSLILYVTWYIPFSEKIPILKKILNHNENQHILIDEIAYHHCHFYQKKWEVELSNFLDAPIDKKMLRSNLANSFNCLLLDKKQTI